MEEFITVYHESRQPEFHAISAAEREFNVEISLCQDDAINVYTCDPALASQVAHRLNLTDIEIA